MNLLKKINIWLNGDPLLKVEEFIRYKIIITLTDGEKIECYPNEYHINLNSYASWFMMNRNEGVNIGGTFYPVHMIRCVDDEVWDTELVYRQDEYFGWGGLSWEDVQENQEQYKNIIDEYRRENGVCNCVELSEQQK